MNRLQELWIKKQSVWLDLISRQLLKSGELKRLIKEDGVRGLTSNPTIFEKAIGGGKDYDADLKKLAKTNLSTEAIYEALAIADIQAAADAFSGVFKESNGTDGFVSLEVSPDIAHDTEATIAHAKSLWKRVKRPNLMIKVPGTPEGVPAVEELTAFGININITLLFSLESYKAVLEAYLRGLERRLRKGQPISSIASVASFFVSRVDTIVDKALDAKIAANGPDAEKAKAALHKAAIANAKLAYKHFLDVTASSRFQKLAKKGAHVQRLLWASTSTKDKRLPDVIYVNELIGPDTVNTMPPQTIEAFRDHGTLAVTLTDGVEQAQKDIVALASVGIDFEALMKKLQDDGVASFSTSYESLLRTVGAKRELLSGHLMSRLGLELGRYQEGFRAAVARAKKEDWPTRTWQKDAAVWKKDEAHAAIIKNSLGWLTVPAVVRRHRGLLAKIVADVKKAKFSNVLLLGMGGSSLCPEVLRLTFGRRPGYPDLSILDSTEPASVMERAKRSRPEKTLYIVASKSGSTTEPNAFLATFYEEVRKKKGDKAGENFIAITDPGTSMEKIAREKKFRHIVLNPPDIGGRYSALSFFGMVPAAIMGAPVDELIEFGNRMADACSPLVPADRNPGVLLGAALGSLAQQKRNKTTFFLSKDIGSFATWVEQLIAESTGKEGKGILPVESEGLAQPSVYGDDRVFVSVTTKSPAETPAKLAALKKAGHPLIRVDAGSKNELGAQFFLWEFATAVAGAFLGIDAFDQPNVQESKDLTKQFLQQYRDKGTLSTEKPVVEEDGIAVYATNGNGKAGTVDDALKSLLSEIRPGDYVALLAYLERNSQHEALLQQIRRRLLESKHVATTVGFGPRFLHSTGQLHKGGDDTGVFLQITADDKKDLAIPGESFGYSVLKEAQAWGDLSALRNKHRRAIRIHLKDSDRGLKKLLDLVTEVTKN